jgi:hypothetical protein
MVSYSKMRAKMNNKQFDAILDKNILARYIKRGVNYGNIRPVDAEYIIYMLGEIERYTGVANQPTVDSIFNAEMDI